MKHALGSLLIASTLNLAAAAPEDPPLIETAHEFALSSLKGFHELLSLPNDAHFPESLHRNIEWCERAFRARHFTTARLDTAGAPLLLATLGRDAATKTILIYLQLDGQPVDASEWSQESPWKPALKRRGSDGHWSEIPWGELRESYDPDYRIFARSASDAKGPVAMFLAALDTAEHLDIRPNYNIKVIMDFEEELGSPNLPDAVTRFRDELAADALIIFDGPRHTSNDPTLIFGARGIATVSLETFGPRRPVHSGHYGNYAPNPALALASLLGSMKDEAGRVSIPGWYDGIELTDETRQILRRVPDDEQMIREMIGIAEPDHVAPTYQESIQYPSLNILGLESGWVRDQTRTIVPASALAELDVRLVVESDPEHLLGLLRRHIADQGFHIVEGSPSERERAQHARLIRIEAQVSYGAFRTEFDTPLGTWLRRAMRSTFGHDPIQIRMSGGSIPIAPFVVTLGIPAVLVPTVNPDNNQHSPDENLRVGNYVDGVKTFLALLSEPFE